MHLLDHFTLLRTQVIRLQGELLKPVPAETPHQLKVEIKLTPSTLPAESTSMPDYQLGCRMLCLGHAPEQEDDPLFRTEVLMNAIYRQVHGNRIDFQTFSHHHGQFNRQVYPLMRHWIMQQVLTLQIPNVQLPQDLFTRMEAETTEWDSAGTEPPGRLH